MRDMLCQFAARRPALTAAIGSTLAAGATASVLVVAGGAPMGAIASASLAGIAVAVMAGWTFGTLLQRHVAVLEDAAERIGELAAACGHADDLPGDADPFDHGRLERSTTAVARAWHNMARERAQSQAALDQQIARQAEFYARLSHELRSPLNAILGYASLAIEDAEAGELAELPQDLRKIRGAGQNLLALIDNLLQLAEDRTGRESVARAPFALREVLLQAAREHAETVPGLVIEVADDAGPETLFGNRTKAARAIGSALDDAVRSRHATAIAIATRPAANPDGAVEILVTAEGLTAIKPGEDGNVTRHLADRLAAAAGGSLEVDFGDGALTRYLLRLPLDVDAAPGASVRPITLDEIPAAAAEEGDKTALVIDDDAATIELMSRWLERSGYRVRTAANADHGLAIAQTMRPDIVLLDALMPGRTGYDILPDLSALPALRDTPILIVTVDDDRLRGLAAGASDYVRKPITESRLREIISVYERDLDGEVLIVEDDADSAEMLERTVRRLGFSTRRACDGAEGLAALAERTPAAILLDLNMPNLNGFEFIEQLAQSEHYAAIPLIVLSGQELSVAQHHRLLASGCRYYMKGTAAPREIAETLREMVA